MVENSQESWQLNTESQNGLNIESGGLIKQLTDWEEAKQHLTDCKVDSAQEIFPEEAHREPKQLETAIQVEL